MLEVLKSTASMGWGKGRRGGKKENKEEEEEEEEEVPRQNSDKQGYHNGYGSVTDHGLSLHKVLSSITTAKKTHYQARVSGIPKILEFGR